MFTLPKLPYAYDALEPYIDAKTMELHHSKHHQTYVDKLNTALESSEWQDRPIEQILQELDKLPEEIRGAVRNNGGGHYNHALFWQMLTPSDSSKLEGHISVAIDTTFGNVENFKKVFNDAAVGRFGSGWVWLIKDSDGALEIVSTPNQDSPINEGIEPLLGLDVWEHAYYLKYQNRRPEYVENWWSVVNWQFVNSRLA